MKNIDNYLYDINNIFNKNIFNDFPDDFMFSYEKNKIICDVKISKEELNTPNIFKYYYEGFNYLQIKNITININVDNNSKYYANNSCNFNYITMNNNTGLFIAKLYLTLLLKSTKEMIYIHNFIFIMTQKFTIKSNEKIILDSYILNLINNKVFDSDEYYDELRKIFLTTNILNKIKYFLKNTNYIYDELILKILRMKFVINNKILFLFDYLTERQILLLKFSMELYLNKINRNIFMYDNMFKKTNNYFYITNNQSKYNKYKQNIGQNIIQKYFYDRSKTI